MMQTRQQHVGLQPQNHEQARRADDSPSNSTKHSMQHSPFSASPRYETRALQPKKKKTVSFSTVEIREYKVILGDNSNCPLPLALDWERALEPTIMNVHYYEVLQERRGRRQNKKLIKMDVYWRRIRLQNMGYPKRLLHKAQHEFDLQRRRTNKAAHQTHCNRTKKWTLPEID